MFCNALKHFPLTQLNIFKPKITGQEQFFLLVNCRKIANLRLLNK